MLTFRGWVKSLRPRVVAAWLKKSATGSELECLKCGKVLVIFEIPFEQ